ncbi:MAG: hypothetical protein OEU54_09560 [Gemmatimonadota bacterium]|nr:hypothetical protein [Gemmatimonadota bacterium]
MADAVGPVYAGRFEEFVIQEGGSQYTILYLADRNNEALQAEGKPPVYYWVPGEVRLARFGDTGDYKFRHIHFVGVMDENLHVGVEGNSEVVGGLMALTTTSRYPTEVLQQATEQLLDKYRGDDDRYWGWRSSAAPRTAMVPITSNTTAITNLAPGRDGTAPAENINPPGGDSGPGAAPPGRSLVRAARMPSRVEHYDPSYEGKRNRPLARSNLDAWAFELQGQGPGSVTGGENAYSGLMGAYPSELIWAGFHGGYSPMVVSQNLIMPMWSQEIWLKITGNWDRIFTHFSGHANAGYMWASADIKAEFNSLRINGGIEVELAIDGTTPQGQDAQKAIEARIDVIVEQFTKQAAQIIFEPPMPEVEPAEAPSGGLLSKIYGGHAGLALRARRDEQHIDLHFEETRYFRYNQPTTISSSLQGLARVIEADPEAESLYFQRLILGDLSRKVTRIVKPIVNWPETERNWVGQPVSFMSAQVGYPDENGVPQFTQTTFQSTDATPDTSWEPAFVRRDADEVSNAPAGWTPEQTFVRRKVHLQEPPSSFANSFVHLSIEQNEVDLDAGEHGTMSDEGVLEVRADRVGVLEVGPINLGVVLQDETQVVEVTFFPAGRTLDGDDREPVRFQWRHDDQNEPRYLKIYTGDLNYQPDYDFEVRVIVRGTLFSPGMEWSGERLRGTGNGPLMITVPPADSVPTDRVIRHSPRQLAGPATAALPPSSSEGSSRPPGVRSSTSRSTPETDSEGYSAIREGFELGTAGSREARSMPPSADPSAQADGDDGDDESEDVLAAGWYEG